MAIKIGRTLALGAFLAGLATGPLLAADAQTTDIIRQRIDGFREVGAAFKNINDELKKKEPVVYVVQLMGRQIRGYSNDQLNWFPAGSGPQPGIKMAAKPEIWQKPAEFKALQEAFVTEAATFVDVASTGEVPKIRKQMLLLSKACSNCHEKFRNDEKK